MNPNDTKPVTAETNPQPIPVKPDARPVGTGAGAASGTAVVGGAAGANSAAPTAQTPAKTVNPS